MVTAPLSEEEQKTDIDVKNVVKKWKKYNTVLNEAKKNIEDCESELRKYCDKNGLGIIDNTILAYEKSTKSELVVSSDKLKEEIQLATLMGILEKTSYLKVGIDVTKMAKDKDLPVVKKALKMSKMKFLDKEKTVHFKSVK